MKEGVSVNARSVGAAGARGSGGPSGNGPGKREKASGPHLLESDGDAPTRVSGETAAYGPGNRGAGGDQGGGAFQGSRRSGPGRGQPQLLNRARGSALDTARVSVLPTPRPRQTPRGAVALHVSSPSSPGAESVGEPTLLLPASHELEPVTWPTR